MKRHNNLIFGEFSPLLLSFPEIQSQKMFVYMMSREQSNGVARPLPRTRGAEGSVAEHRASSFSSLFKSINLIQTASSSTQVACFYEPERGTWLLSAAPGIITSIGQKQRQTGKRRVLACCRIVRARMCTVTVFVLRPTHKDLFQMRMNTRCHLRGSGGCSVVANRQRKERSLCNSRGHGLLVFLWTGEVVFFFSLQWLWHFLPMLWTDPSWKCRTISSKITWQLGYLSRF